jgi:serine/alanine adding enzyme
MPGADRLSMKAGPGSESDVVGVGPITVQPVELPPAEWDAFVRASERATFAHLSCWRKIIADVMGHEAVYFVARDHAGGTAGVLPLFILRSPIFGRRLVSVPLLNYGGPLGSPAAVRALLDRAVQEARRRRMRVMELRTRTAPPSDLTTTARKVTVLLPLPDDPEELWTGLKAKVRSQVRRPMKEGMEVRFGADQLQPFYHVLSRNMRDMGTPVLPARLFERIAGAFGDEAEFGVVYHQDEPVAAGGGFVFRDEFEMTWASSLREHNRSAPNMLLYWAFMERMIGRGVRTFNFGRCTPGGGTHSFKLQWGGHDLPLPWLTWTPGTAPEGAPHHVLDDAGPGRIARLVSGAWSRLPVAVANRVGPVVARQLPWW